MITAAEILGRKLELGGYLFAKDFPEIVREIGQRTELRPDFLRQKAEPHTDLAHVVTDADLRGVADLRREKAGIRDVTQVTIYRGQRFCGGTRPPTKIRGLSWDSPNTVKRAQEISNQIRRSNHERGNDATTGGNGGAGWPTRRNRSTGSWANWTRSRRH